jgi:hypothetical protein
MFESGLAIFVSDIPLAGALLERLNKMGAEVELFSRNG